jgi:hypothetical protein
MVGGSDRAERDAVLVLSDLIRKIDRSREAVLKSAGDHAFGYTADAAEEMSHVIEDSLALCRRCEKVLQMWSALSAATTASDLLRPPAVGPLADEVQRAVREFEAVAEAARSSMVQVGSRKEHAPRRQPEGWAELFGRPMEEKLWDQLFAMPDETSPAAATAGLAGTGGPAPAFPSGALGIWSNRLAESVPAVACPPSSVRAAHGTRAGCSHLYTSSDIEGAFLKAAEAMAASSAPAPNVAGQPGRRAGAAAGREAHSSAVASTPSGAGAAGLRRTGAAEAEVGRRIERVRALAVRVEGLAASVAWSFGRGGESLDAQLRQLEDEARTEARQARSMLGDMHPTVATAELRSALDSAVARMAELAAAAHSTIGQVREGAGGGRAESGGAAGGREVSIRAHPCDRAELNPSARASSESNSHADAGWPLTVPQLDSANRSLAEGALQRQPAMQGWQVQVPGQRSCAESGHSLRAEHDGARHKHLQEHGRSGRQRHAQPAHRRVPPASYGPLGRPSFDQTDQEHEHPEPSQLPPQLVLSEREVSRTPSQRQVGELEARRQRMLRDAVRLNNELIDERGRAIEAIATEVQELGELFVEVAQLVESHDEPIQQLGRDIEAAEFATAAAARELEKAAKNNKCVVS